MSTFAIPFSLNTSGGVQQESDPAIRTHQRIRTLIATRPGERVMRPAYGSNAAAFLFEYEDSVQLELEQHLKGVIETYEPGVVVSSVEPKRSVSDEYDGIVDVNIEYYRVDDPTTPLNVAQHINKAVISVGGSVSEVVK